MTASREEIFQAALEILRSEKGGEASRLARPAEDFPAARSRKKPLEVWNGSVCVKIYAVKWRDKKRRKSYRSYELRWTDAGQRFRQKKSNLEDAKRRAFQIAGAISTGETNRLQFSQADIAEYLLIKQTARDVGLEPALLVQEAAALKKQLPGISFQEIGTCYAALHPVGAMPRTVAEVLAEFFSKRAPHISKKYLNSLHWMLDPFAARFGGRIIELSAREIEDWLDSLKKENKTSIGLRCRSNIRDSIITLCNFAKARGYLPQSWNVMDSVSNPNCPDVVVHIYTPDELLRILNTAENHDAGRKLVPFIAITAFAGVRHGEMNENKMRLLDWADIDFEAKSIYVAKKAAKTGGDRVVDMPDNLIAWIKPYARPSGRICVLKNTSNGLYRLRIKAGVLGPRQNSLRKSFISYKNALTRNIEATADQAGNSPAIIRKNYKYVDTKMRMAAQRWFSLMPDRADLLPLFAWTNPA